MPHLLPDPLNIHKNSKYLKGKEDSVPNGTIAYLAEALKSPGPLGKALRTLVRRVRHPRSAYTEEDLEQLLVLSLALARNQEEK